MKKIELTQGKFAIVDNEDFEFFTHFNWYFNNGYAVRRLLNKKAYLHRAITKANKGQIVDHINRNKLDNRKRNLRFVTVNQNNLNRDGYGVHWNKRKNKWRAMIRIGNGQRKFLGYFRNKREAIKVYKDYRKTLLP